MVKNIIKDRSISKFLKSNRRYLSLKACKRHIIDLDESDVFEILKIIY